MLRAQAKMGRGSAAVIVLSLNVTPFHTPSLLRSFSASGSATRNSAIKQRNLCRRVPMNVGSSPLHLASNLLILNHHKIISFTVNPLIYRREQQSLNQRVPGSSPGAPTNNIKHLN